MALAVGLLTLAGCLGEQPARVPAGRFGETRSEFLTSLPYPVDLLFVIDRSAAMPAWREQVAADRALVVDALEQITLGGLDLHVEVVFQYDRRPLATMQRALDPNGPLNSSFLRSEASLAVVFIAADDDCVPESTPAALDFLHQLKRGGSRILFAALTPEASPQPSCPYRTLAEALGDAATLAPIDDPNLDYELWSPRYEVEPGSMCIRGDLTDVPPSDPTAIPLEGSAVHVACTVSDVRDYGTDGAKETVVPACSTGASPPCWRTVYDPASCPAPLSPRRARFMVVRLGAPEGSIVVTVVRCQADD